MSYWRQPHVHIIHGLSRRRLTGFNRFPDRRTARRSLEEQKAGALDRILYDVEECTDLCQPMVFNGEPWDISETPPEWLILDDSAPPLMVSRDDPTQIVEVPPGSTPEEAWQAAINTPADPPPTVTVTETPTPPVEATVTVTETPSPTVEPSSSSTDYGTDTSSSSDTGTSISE